MCFPSGDCPDKIGEPSGFQLVRQKVPTGRLTCLVVEPVSPCSPKTGREDQQGKTERRGEAGKRGMCTEMAFLLMLRNFLCCLPVCVRVHPSGVL